VEQLKTFIADFLKENTSPCHLAYLLYALREKEKIDNSDYNRALKALGASAGISIPLHSHLARHTFATFMLRNGVKIENLSKMLGHTNISRTQRYAKVLAQSVHEDFTKISNLIKQRNNESKNCNDGSDGVAGGELSKK
jgi:site-specific recombinase XerD